MIEELKNKVSSQNREIEELRNKLSKTEDDL